MDSTVVADHPSKRRPSSNTMVMEQLSEEATRASPSASPPSPPSTPSYPPTGAMTGTYATLGVISAIISLFILPEIFGTAAIILGAYTWRREQGNRGIYVLILGIICMLVGLYFTAYFILGDLLPS